MSIVRNVTRHLPCKRRSIRRVKAQVVSFVNPALKVGVNALVHRALALLCKVSDELLNCEAVSQETREPENSADCREMNLFLQDNSQLSNNAKWLVLQQKVVDEF